MLRRLDVWICSGPSAGSPHANDGCVPRLAQGAYEGCTPYSLNHASGHHPAETMNRYNLLRYIIALCLWRVYGYPDAPRRKQAPGFAANMRANASSAVQASARRPIVWSLSKVSFLSRAAGISLGVDVIIRRRDEDHQHRSPLAAWNKDDQLHIMVRPSRGDFANSRFPHFISCLATFLNIATF